MKILVISDSHGAADAIVSLAQALSPDLVLHLGDCETDTEPLRKALPELPLLCVRGNCDAPSDTPDYRLIEPAGHRIFLTHGHRYRVKFSPDALLNTASILGAELVLFGHTHRQTDVTVESLRVINPGSLGTGGTYALLELSEGGVSCTLCKSSVPL